jgi:uncharacterized protein
VRVIRANEYRRMRWKNGLGETAEIAISPEGAPLDQFDWRISMARIEAPGPFSAFPGVDRTLTVLDGDGCRIAIDGNAAVELTPRSAPFPFSGDSQAAATLLGGTVTDLNVMTRRGRYWHRVRRLASGDRPALEATEGTAMIFCASGSVRVSSSVHHAELAARDTLLVGQAAGALDIDSPARASLLLVEIGRC